MSNSIYLEDPPVYLPLMNFLITDKKEVIECCTSYEKLGIYDTCSIQYHANSSSRELLAAYFQQKFDVLLLTRTVLMELPHSPTSAQQIIDYFSILHSLNIKIVLFDEELVFDCIKEDNGFTNKEVNQSLCYGICSVKRIPGLKSIFDNEASAHIRYLPNNAPDTPDFYTTFFKWVRSKKTASDGLGECLAMLVSYVFCTQPYGRRIIITDDRSMWGNIELVRRDVTKHYQQHEPRIITTATILCGMYRLGISTDPSILKEIALCTKATPLDNFNFIYLIEDGDTLIEHTGLVTDLIDKILDSDIARILY